MSYSINLSTMTFSYLVIVMLASTGRNDPPILGRKQDEPHGIIIFVIYTSMSQYTVITLAYKFLSHLGHLSGMGQYNF